MALVEMNWHPDERQLRQFGLIGLVMLTGITLVLYLLGALSNVWALVLVVIGAGLFGLSRISTRLIRPIYLILLALAWPIGWVVSHVVMGIFYFLILTPIGLVFRLLGRDPLHRKFDRRAVSYWVEHRPPEDAQRYFHQF